MYTSRTITSGRCSPIFLRAAEPLLTVITSYPASVRIFRPMFWAVTLSSASRIFRAKGYSFAESRDNAKVPCPLLQVNVPQAGNGYDRSRLLGDGESAGTIQTFH